MALLWEKPLSPADGKVWKQVIAMLMGLKMRNGFGEEDLAAAVGAALRRGQAVNCEDCRVKVAYGLWGCEGVNLTWYKVTAPQFSIVNGERGC
jgi:hypothetical protein